MEAMQRVIETLDGNKKISVEVKKEMLSLISEFHSRFPSVSLDTLCRNLRHLSIEKGSKFVYASAINYSPLDNKIFINEEMLNSEKIDASHSMMKAIIGMTTQKDIHYGFNNNSSLEALNVGFCEILANNLAGNEGESQFVDEQVLVNYIGSSIGFDIFQKAFFENNPELLMKELLTKCSSPEKLNDLLSQANNNMHTRRKSGESRLYHIQAQALSMFEVDKSFHFQRAALQDLSTKYIDYEEIDELVNEQLREWTRGK